MNFFQAFVEVISKAGVFVYPIIICSIFGLTIFLQKLWFLRKDKILPSSFLTQLYKLLEQGKLSDAISLSYTNDSSISRIALTALENSQIAKEELKEKIEEVGQRESIEMGRFIESLGAVSNVSTLLGLLGTISGMIKIFRVISTSDIVNPPALAGGISEALYTTAIGLCVAIPAFIAYKFLSGKYEEMVTNLEQESHHLLDIITDKSIQQT